MFIENCNRVSVLIAEDNPVNQKLLEYLIRSKGWDCNIVDDGEKAVHACCSNHYDLILIDIQMPVLDGIQATRAIRTTNKTIPIIAVTATPENAMKDASLDAGMNDFISKPLNVDTFFNSVTKYISYS